MDLGPPKRLSTASACRAPPAAGASHPDLEGLSPASPLRHRRGLPSGSTQPRMNPVRAASGRRGKKPAGSPAATRLAVRRQPWPPPPEAQPSPARGAAGGAWRRRGRAGGQGTAAGTAARAIGATTSMGGGARLLPLLLLPLLLPRGSAGPVLSEADAEVGAGQRLPPPRAAEGGGPAGAG